MAEKTGVINRKTRENEETLAALAREFDEKPLRRFQEVKEPEINTKEVEPRFTEEDLGDWLK